MAAAANPLSRLPVAQAPPFPDVFSLIFGDDFVTNNTAPTSRNRRPAAVT
jgi:hypothetical protein